MPLPLHLPHYGRMQVLEARTVQANTANRERVCCQSVCRPVETRGGGAGICVYDILEGA